MPCYKTGGHVMKKHGGRMMKKAEGGSMAKKERMKEDQSADKRLVKKAIRQHDDNMHGGKTETLKLRHGGKTMMREGGKATMKRGGRMMKKADGGSMVAKKPSNERSMAPSKAPKAQKTAPRTRSGGSAPMMKKKTAVSSKKSMQTDVPVLGSPVAGGMEESMPMGNMAAMGQMGPMKHGGVVHHVHYSHGGGVERHEMGGPVGAGMAAGAPPAGALAGAGMGAGMAGAPAAGMTTDPRLRAQQRRLQMLMAQQAGPGGMGGAAGAAGAGLGGAAGALGGGAGAGLGGMPMRR